MERKTAWNEYKKKDMKKLEIETAVSYQQAALERYNNR